MRLVWSLSVAIAALILLATSPIVLCQQSDGGNAAEMEKQIAELNATMARLSQDMDAFDKANATINYSSEQVDGVWYNVTIYTSKDGRILKEYLDANNKINQTMFIVPEDLLTTKSAGNEEEVLTILSSSPPCEWILIKKTTEYPLIKELYNPCLNVKLITRKEADGTVSYVYHDYTKAKDNTYTVIKHGDGSQERSVETYESLPPECTYCENTHAWECKEEVAVGPSPSPEPNPSENPAPTPMPA